MQIIIAIVLAIPLLIAIFLIYSKIKRRKLIEKYKNSYHDFNDEDYDFESLKQIRRYWDNKKENENPDYFIDDTTWNDLDMDYLFFKINATRSSVGSEYLYSKLRSVSFEEEELIKFGNKVDLIDKNPSLKVNALIALHHLGKDLFNNAYDFIFNVKSYFLKNVFIYYILMALPILGIILCFFTKAGIAVIILAYMINVLFYERNKFKLELGLNTISYIQKIVICASQLSNIDFNDADLSERLNRSLKSLKKITVFTDIMLRMVTNEIEQIFKLIKIIFMIDFISYNRTVKILLKHSKELHEVFKIVGEIDTVIAISEYRKFLPYYCKPTFKDVPNVIFEDLYHPMVKDCVPNSIDITKNIILTGSNASGKSTFIKSLAINMILAQNIYMCLSKEYSAKMSWVITSMAVKDNVISNESYFMAEIKSLKRIIDSLEDNIRIVCFIDEILKGTNTIERVAASSSILNYLSAENCIVITASHDIELTEIMRNLYDNYHFKEEVTDEGVVFDYKLLNGHATTKNAIHLLKFMGYNKKIVDKANELAEGYIDKRKWNILSLY